MEGYEILLRSNDSYAILISQDEVLMFRAFMKAKLEIMKNARYQTYLRSTGTFNMNYMNRLINDVFTQLIEAGIPQHFTDRVFNFFPKFDELKEPQTFSLDDLWFGFEIWLFACAATTCVFILEIIIFWTSENVLRFTFVKRLTGMRF